MSARKKPANLKKTATSPIRLSPDLKKDMDAMAEETGVSVSQYARDCFEQLVKEWKARK